MASRSSAGRVPDVPLPDADFGINLPASASSTVLHPRFERTDRGICAGQRRKIGIILLPAVVGAKSSCSGWEPERFHALERFVYAGQSVPLKWSDVLLL